MDLRPYPAYKPSRVEWLENVPVPAHWEIRRLKTLCTMESGDGITAISVDPAGTFPVYGGNGVRGYTSNYTHDGNFILIGRQGALCGNVHIARGRFWASEHAVVVTTRSGYSPEWLGAILEVVNLNQYSIAAAQPGLSAERVLKLRLPVPSVPEQTAIVRFLDHADQRIGRYIRAKQKLIALLDEQKQAVMHQVVTGQIDVRTRKPYATYKRAGVEWLQNVPTSWEITPLRHRYHQCLGKMLDSKQVTGRWPLPYLRNADAQWDHINVDNLPMMDICPEDHDRYTLDPGDLLVCEGGEVGRCAIWDAKLPSCGFQKALHRLRPRNATNDLPRFMYYALRVASLSQAFTDGHQSTIAHLTGDKLRAHRFPFPSFVEQRAIVDDLDGTTNQIDAAICRHRRKIDLLEEYRCSLIAGVVTGRLDIRAAVDSQPHEKSTEDLEFVGAMVKG